MSAIAANPAWLTNLKELYDAGLIDGEELASERSKIFDCPGFSSAQPCPAAPGLVESALVSLAATQVDLVRILGDLANNIAHGGSKKRAYDEDSAESVDTVLRPEGQASLFSLGVKMLPKKPAKRKKLAMPLGTHKCPRCDFVTTKPGPLHMHMMHKHSITTGGKQSVASLFLKQMTPEQRAKESERLQLRARDVDIAFIISDLIASAVASSTKVGGWRAKDDRRRHNKGLHRRLTRSIAFKAKVIHDYERYQKQMPAEYKGVLASIVADLWNISKNQVNTMVRNKADILKKYHCRATRNTCRFRQSQGMFAKEEQKVYDSFLENRKVGRQIGPKWIRQAMQREVRKIVHDPASVYAKRLAAGAFRGGSSWLFRFAKRWNICLRRKTNVKKKPIQERAKKIQRWMALYRLYLTAFQDHQGYSTKWSIYPPQCRWSLDQVPAGLYDPKCTYAERGSDRVHIASNGSLRHAL